MPVRQLKIRNVAGGCYVRTPAKYETSGMALGMVSDPVNGPGSARRKAAVLLSISVTAYTTICSGIPNLCHVRNALSELGEALV